MILSFYGDGKGKTSAALGISLRAAGYGKRILFVQFIKGDWPTGEQKYLEKMENVEFKQFGLGFVGIKGDNLPLKSHREEAKKGIEYLKENITKFDLVVLDEIFGAVKGKLVTVKEATDIFSLARDNNINLVATGRPEIKPLLDASDLISEIKNIRHPFDSGSEAIQAIDY